MKMNVIAFGNPLLDTIILLEENALLVKYNLKTDDQKEVSQQEMRLLVNDIQKYEKTVTAGGCAQNTLKVMQWLLQNRCSTTIIGSTGNDNEGKLLKSILEEQGVQTSYFSQPGYDTGMTVSLVSGENRSLVACLGAAEILTLENVANDLQLPSHIKAANLVYMEGFFVTKRIEVALFILKLCKTHRKTFAFNVSAQYLCRENPNVMQMFVEQADILFGNKREFEALYPIMQYNSVENMLLELGKIGKIIAMTNGADSVIYVDKENYGKVHVPLIDSSHVVDTTGAGDSFVAGFLVGCLLKKPLNICSEIGNYAAQEIIKYRGCIVPDYKPKIDLYLD